MLRFKVELHNYYDESTKILSGSDFKPYYDRSCSFGRIAFEELRRRPNHICQICDSDDTRLTNNELRLQAIRLARFFESLGLRQDDIIGFSGANTTYAMSVPLACFFTGIACHAVSPYQDKATSKKLFNITRPKVIFCDGQNIEKILFASSDFETKIVTLSNHVKSVPSILDLLQPTGDEHEFVPAELENGPDQNLFLHCTSGTTGTPKVVTVPHSTSICRGVNNLFTSEDVQFINSTLDWVSSLTSVLNCVVHGVTRVITAKPLTAEYFCEIIEKYKVTVTFQTPPATTMIIRSPQIIPKKLDSLRYYMIGGAATSTTLIQTVQKLLRNGQVFERYGCTELNSSLTINLYSENKPCALGRLLPGYKVRIANDKGENLGKNEIGEMCCIRPSVWRGFYDNPEATREIYDAEGWLHTGDLCYIDDDNYLFMVGRKKELLKYKSMHYYPKDIEEIIYEIPDVKEVCVFGIEDELVGENAAAAVVKMEESLLREEDIVDYVRKRTDGEHKQLHGGCKFFKEIPRTASNKYDRNAAKVMFLNKL